MAIYCQYEGINCLSCTEGLKKARGCYSEVNCSLAGIETNRCPRKFVTMKEIFRIQAYSQYKRGFLPNPGTWQDQPQKFFDFCTIIENVLSDIEENERKRLKNGRR